MLGQTEAQGNSNLDIDGLDANNDFLSRERAALGDDAAQFAGSGDASVMMDGGEDDLLGGGGSYSAGHAGDEEVTEFASSYPAIDMRNDVGTIIIQGWSYPSDNWYSTWHLAAQSRDQRRLSSLNHRMVIMLSKKKSLK